jgi:hypothetical protein
MEKFSVFLCRKFEIILSTSMSFIMIMMMLKEIVMIRYRFIDEQIVLIVWNYGENYGNL